LEENEMARFCFWVIFLILFAVGCGETVEEKAMEKKIKAATGADADIDLSEKGMKIKGDTDGGKFTVSTGKLVEIPKDFPSDVFIFSPSKAVVAIKMPKGYSVSLTTGEDLPTVEKTYKREMQAKGWSEATSMNMGDQSMLMYEKKNRAANITIASTEGETQIVVMITTN